MRLSQQSEKPPSCWDNCPNKVWNEKNQKYSQRQIMCGSNFGESDVISSIKQFQSNQEMPIKLGFMFKYKTAGWKK